jgi:hypothetical protein
MQKLFFLFIIASFSFMAKAQNLSFALKTSKNIALVFSTIDQYKTGIIVPNAATLYIDASSVQWDLYVGITTTTPNLWDVTTTYSSTGNLPDINIVEAQFRNASNTSQVNGFFSLSDISNPTYIIGSAVNPDLTANCPSTGTNSSGTYITSPTCHQFNVDLKVTPGLGLRPGLYTLRIDYVIVQDL